MQSERFSRGIPALFVLMGLGALMSGAAGSAAAQVSPEMRIDLPAQQVRTGIELDLELRTRESQETVSQQTTRSLSAATLPELRVGETVEVCFRSTEMGYVTLWSRTSGNPPVRIYPNAYSHAGAEALAEAVSAAEQVCVGGDNRFLLRVMAPGGVTSSLYLHWTPQRAQQLPADAFPSIGRGPRTSERQARYASTTLEYRVIE